MYLAAPAADVAPENPLWVVVLVGAASGVIGAIVGPIIQRVFTRNDRALDARQAWAKDKLQTVFGLGDELHSSDGPTYPFMRLVPPSGYTAQWYDMHTINWSLQESVDLMMLQPRRSRWARQWLYDWHFVLQPQASRLHSKMHELRAQGVWSDPAWERQNTAYERRVRRVESSLSIWATGQWLTHPSLRLWIGQLGWVRDYRDKRRWAINAESPQPPVGCDCINQQELHEAMEFERRAAEGEKPVEPAGN